MPVQTGFFQTATVGYRHQLRVMHHRHGQLGALLFIDLGLIHLDIGLAQLAGRNDHVGAMVVGGFDDVADLLLRFFRLGERQRTAATGDFRQGWSGWLQLKSSREPPLEILLQR